MSETTTPVCPDCARAMVRHCRAEHANCAWLVCPDRNCSVVVDPRRDRTYRPNVVKGKRPG